MIGSRMARRAVWSAALAGRISNEGCTALSYWNRNFFVIIGVLRWRLHPPLSCGAYNGRACLLEGLPAPLPRLDRRRDLQRRRVEVGNLLPADPQALWAPHQLHQDGAGRRRGEEL